MNTVYDVIIVGTGAAGLFCALNFPETKKVCIITKRRADESDSFWRRAAYVCCGVRKITKIILKTP